MRGKTLFDKSKGLSILSNNDHYLCQSLKETFPEDDALEAVKIHNCYTHQLGFNRDWVWKPNKLVAIEVKAEVMGTIKEI